MTEGDTSFTVATTDKPLVYIAGQAATVEGTAGAWTVAKPEIAADTCVSFVKDQAITAPQQKWYESPKRVGIMWYDQEKHTGYGSNDYTGLASSFDGLYVGLAYGSNNTESYLGNVANIIDGDTTNIYAYKDNNRGNCVSKEWGVMLVGTAGSENKLRAWNLNENSKIATVTLKADGYDSFSGDSIAIIGNKLWVNGYAGANNKAIYRFTIPASGFVDGLELTAEAVVTAAEQIRNFRVYEVGGKFIVYAKADAAFYVGTMEDGLVKKDDFNTNDKGRYCDVAVAGSHLYIFNAYTADVEMYDIDTTTGWFASEAVPTKISMLEVCGQPSWTSNKAGRGSSIFVTPDETTLVHCGYYGASAVQYCPAYEVKFVVDGVEIATNKVWEGDTTTAPADPEKAGYTFDGWFDGEDHEFDPAATVTADATYTAKFTADTFAITIALDGATAPAGWTAGTIDGTVVTNFTVESADFDLPALVKDGFNFTGYVKGDETTTNLVVTIDCSLGEGAQATYTACFEAAAPAWPGDWPGDADPAVVDKFAAWKAANPGVTSFEGHEEQFLMNVAADAQVPELKIESITVEGDTATIVVGAQGVNLEKGINGKLFVDGTDELGAEWASTVIDATAESFTEGKATFTVPNAKFMKARVDFSVPELPAE